MNSGLYVHRSNRLEELAEQLGTLVEQPLPDPLQPEIIMVQSLGMRRWLGLTLAARLGVAMNCEFPFPHALAHQVFRSAFPDVPETPAFSREMLPWRIDALLPELITRPAFEDLRRYIGSGETSALKQFQLSRQLSTLYDRHLVHRAEDLLKWQRGEGNTWQESLWRELVSGHEQDHPPALLERLMKRIADGDTSLPDLPPRLSVFGISSLSTYYIELLRAVAKCAELHLFLFEPTDQYWGDIKSPVEQKRFLRRHAKPEQTAEDFHLEIGNALLASLGKPGRLFVDDILRLDPTGFDECFVPPPQRSLLTRLQADLFELRHREDGECDTIESGDRTIQVHCCHGPMREVEVLYDQLLDLFQQLPGLTPKDILVMMPDVEKYAPFIEAVFDAPEDESLRIPFTIADRSAAAENGSARALLKLLGMQGSRFGAATVLGLLEMPPIQKRFRLSDSDLEIIRDWVESIRIRWGIDPEHRAGFDVPAFGQNSWKDGLDRLLLGYALPGDGIHTFAEMLPAEGIEGGLTDVLGAFADFSGKLFELIPPLAEARTLDQWESALGQILSAFIDDSEESADEIRRIRMTLETLVGLAAVHPAAVPFEVIRTHLTQSFADTDSGRGFLVGHATFCSLKPMRSIPFRVICMLGLNDSEFPRRDPEGMLDQMAGAGQTGRSRRDEDRQVFLESLLSAREVFYLSYSGLSTRDNSEAPPSVIVSELVDYLGANYEIPGIALKDCLRVKHRLQPFNRDYFSGSDNRLFSYSKENCRASQKVTPVRMPPAARIDGPLSEPGPEWETVQLSDLHRFFRKPAAYFLTRRLGIRLPDSESFVEESEPLAMDSRDRWRVQHELGTRLFAGEALDANLNAIRATGLLPVGYSGNTILRELSQDVAPLVQRMKDAIQESPLPPEPHVLQIGKWKLIGTLSNRYPSGIYRLTSWKMTPREQLSAWIDHLVLCATQSGSTAPITRLLAIDATVKIEPASTALSILEDLLQIYWEGLREPVPYFQKSSFEFARRTLRAGKRETASPAKSARDVWEKEEKDDAYTELGFRGREPLDERWQELALRIWKPFFEHSTEEKTAE